MRSARLPVIAISLAIVAAATAIATGRLSLSDDVTTMLPTGDKVVSDYFFVADRFRILESLYIDVDGSALEEENAAHLFAVADRLYEALAKSDLFHRIHYKTSPEVLRDLAETYQDSQAALLSESDLHLLEERLTPQAIHRSLAQAKRSLMGATGMFEQERIRQDPFDIGRLVTAKLEGMSKQGQGAQIVDGAIVSADNHHLLIFAVPKSPPADTVESRKLITFLENTRRELEPFAGSGIQIRFAGGHFAHLDNAQTIRRDIGRTVLAMIVGIAVICASSFRRRLSIPLILAPVAFGVAVSLGIFSIFNPSIPGIVVGCSALLIGIAVDYGIHVLYHLDASQDEDSSAQASVRTLAYPLLAGATTTIAAFLTLLLSDIEGQRLMGLLAAMGILGSVLFVLFGLPSFVPLKHRTRRVLPLARVMQTLAAWQETHWKGSLLVTGLVVAVALFGIGKLQFEGDFQQLSYLLPEHQEDDDKLRNVWQGFAPSSVTVRGADLDAALEQNDRIHGLLERLEREGLVQDSASISAILPSAAVQKERWEQWTAFWSKARLSRLETATADAAAELGFLPGAFQPFFDSLNREPSLLTLDDYAGTGIYDLLTSRVISDDHGALVQTTFHTPGLDAFHQARAVIEQEHPSAVVMNGQWFAEHAQGLVSRELVRLSVLASIAVLISLWLVLGRLELAIAVLLPVCLSMVVTLGLLGLAGIPVNLISCLFVVFVLGVGVDFSIFLFNTRLRAYRGVKSHDASTSGSVVLCAFTTLFGFASLMLATHPAIFSIGVTGFIGISASLLMAFTITPLTARAIFPDNGRYGVPTIKTTLGAVWVVTDLELKGFLYLLIFRPYSILRYWGNEGARRHFARRYIHLSYKSASDFLPYRHSVRATINATPDVFDRPAIIVSNHQSMLDIALILSLPCDMVMVVKKWVLRLPLAGTLLRDAGYICTDEGDAEQILEMCRATLDNGTSVMFFPEGTRSRDGVMRRYHRGAFELAIQSGHDILPVLLTNTRACIRPRGFLIGDHFSLQRVLPRVTSANFDYGKGARELANHVKTKTLEYLHPDWRKTQNGVTFWRNLKMYYSFHGPINRLRVACAVHFDPLCDAIDELVPEEGRIVVLGSGLGLLANVLAWKSLTREVTALDDRPPQIAMSQAASRDRSNVSFSLCDLWNPPMEEADAILLVDVLARGSQERQIQLVSEACKWLQPGGVLVFRGHIANRPLSMQSKLDRRVRSWPRLQNLDYIGDRAFYDSVFSRNALTLRSSHPELTSRGKVVWVLEKTG